MPQVSVKREWEKYDYYRDVGWYRYTILYEDGLQLDTWLAIPRNDFIFEITKPSELELLLRIEYAEKPVKLEYRDRKGWIRVETGKTALFIYGNTYPIKDELKKLGFKWHPWMRAWYKVDVSVEEALDIATMILNNYFTWIMDTGSKASH